MDRSPREVGHSPLKLEGPARHILRLHLVSEINETALRANPQYDALQHADVGIALSKVGEQRDDQGSLTSSSTSGQWALNSTNDPRNRLGAVHGGPLLAIRLPLLARRGGTGARGGVGLSLLLAETAALPGFSPVAFDG